MNRHHLYLVAWWLSALACLTNLTAASAGIVHCETTDGRAAVEVGCDHGHCTSPTADLSHHDHDDERQACECTDCACEDTPIEIEIAAKRWSSDAELPGVADVTSSNIAVQCLRYATRSVTRPDQVSSRDHALQIVRITVLRV